MHNPVAIRANDLAFLNLLTEPLKTNLSPKTSYTEQFILFTPMMEIKNPWVL